MLDGGIQGGANLGRLVGSWPWILGLDGFCSPDCSIGGLNCLVKALFRSFVWPQDE